MREPELIQSFHEDATALRDEIAAGLRAPQARCAPKLFYDALGSRLFDAITVLPEYTLPRDEAAAFQVHGDAIAATLAQWAGPGLPLIDLGAGDGAKAERLFPRLRPRAYVAVDISVDYVGQALRALQWRHPDLPIAGLGQDFSQALDVPRGLLAGAAEGPRLVFYPGSSIGNFAPDEAVRLLRQAREVQQGGALLLGADLVKPVPELLAAYDDALGVTAAFNLNVLRRLNTLLGCDADPRDFAHEARWHAPASRIEMHLVARRALTLRWPGGERPFQVGETLHTENAHKYTVESLAALLDAAGHTTWRVWTDPAARFALVLAR